MNNEAARALRIYMAYLSEEGWCAGWVSHLEFTLWEQVLKWRAGIELSPDEGSDGSHWTKDAQALSWLAEQAGGWWQWPRDGNEPEFVALKDWQRIFEEHHESTRDAEEAKRAEREGWLQRGPEHARSFPSNGNAGVGDP